jgi:hypothetical protein
MLSLQHLVVGKTFRGINHFTDPFGRTNDRTIIALDITSMKVEYDDDTVPAEQVFPAVPAKEFLAWAVSEVA